MRHQQIEVPQDATLTGSGAKAAAIAQTVLLFTLTTLPTPLYRDYAREFHFSVLTLTLIYATYVAGTLTSLLFFGRLSDQIGRRPVALIALGITIASALCFLFAESEAWLFPARVLNGFAAGLGAGTMTAWIAELEPRSDRARAAAFHIQRDVRVLALASCIRPSIAPSSGRIAP